MKTKSIVVALTLWCCLLSLGWFYMSKYGSTVGMQAAAPNTIPAKLSQVVMPTANTHKGILFVVLHPQCSCSRATVHELDRVIEAAGQDAPVVYLLMYQPANSGSRWKAEGVLPNHSLRNAFRVNDLEGRYAEALRAATSGETILYSSAGQLLFQGGVTASRGHEGPNSGSDRLLSAIRSNLKSRGMMSVFGCPLFHHNEVKGGAS